MEYNNYYLLFKPADAEFKAWSELDIDNKNMISPIIELTRGSTIRGIPKIEDSSRYKQKGYFKFYEKHLEKIINITEERPSLIDITREDTLMCGELYDLLDNTNGYSNWVNFIEKTFPDNITPILQISNKTIDLETYQKDLINQFVKLSQKYNSIGYRVSVLLDSGYLTDLNILFELIHEYLKENEKEFLLIFDYNSIKPHHGIIHAENTISHIKAILRNIPSVKFIILSSSFPKNVTEVGNGNKDSFELEEILLFKKIYQDINLKNRIFYGDYGSINPIRNDEKSMARGWVPRIDIPFDNSIIYYREKREDKGYKATYHNLAKIIKEENLLDKLPNCWAKNQIIEATKSTSNVNGSSPKFWIAVRMQLHILNIENQINTIYYKPK